MVALHPLIYPTVFMIVILVISCIIRYSLRKYTSRTFSRRLILEYVATTECFCTCFESQIISAHYGIKIYLLYSFVMLMWRNYSWGSETGCPYRPLEDVYEGKEDVLNALLLIVMQVLAGMMAFRLMFFYWSYELSPIHDGLIKNECRSDLNVPVIIGFLAEGGGTLLARLISRKLDDINVPYTNIIDILFSLAIVAAALKITGAYFNPLYAYICLWPCEQETLFHHVFVYWLAPTLGALIAATIFIYFLKKFNTYSIDTQTETLRRNHNNSCCKNPACN